MQFELVDRCFVLCLVVVVVYLWCQFVNQQFFGGNEVFYCYYVDVVQFVYDCCQYVFCLFLLVGIGLWEGDVGVQNIVLMQVMGQWVEDGVIVMSVGVYQ